MWPSTFASFFASSIQALPIQNHITLFDTPHTSCHPQLRIITNECFWHSLYFTRCAWTNASLPDVLLASPNQHPWFISYHQSKAVSTFLSGKTIISSQRHKTSLSDHGYAWLYSILSLNVLDSWYLLECLSKILNLFRKSLSKSNKWNISERSQFQDLYPNKEFYKTKHITSNDEFLKKGRKNKPMRSRLDYFQFQKN